jgi:hypothetical protein
MQQVDLLTHQIAPLTLTYLQDPGHGWVAADMEHVQRLGIAKQISAYSYISRDGRTVFLEEDCDAARYIEACKAAGIAVELRPHHCEGTSFVRRLPGYPAQPRLFS